MNSPLEQSKSENHILEYQHRGDVLTCEDKRALLHAEKCSIKQAATFLGIGRTKVKSLIDAGRIPVLKIDGKYVLTESDLEQFLAGLYSRGAPALNEISMPQLSSDVINSKHLRY